MNLHRGARRRADQRGPGRLDYAVARPMGDNCLARGTLAPRRGLLCLCGGTGENDTIRRTPARN